MIGTKKGQAAILVLAIVFALFILRAIVVGAYQIALCDAIYLYQVDCMAEGREIDIWQADKESYEDTFRRWWDWSDHNIMEKDKYRKVKPYIGEDVEAWERMVDDG